MTERVPLTILKNLIHNETYTRQVLPFIQPDYFEERIDRIVFEEISKFLDKYDNCLLYTSPSPRDLSTSRMPSSA